MYATLPLLQPAVFHCLLTSASTQENQVRSPLLCLPAELRNRIYELVFSTAAVKARPLLRTLSVKVHPAWDDPKVYPDYDGPRGTMALLQTCRQINTEAMQFFLSTMTFDTELCSLNGFVSAFGEDKAAVMASIVFDPSDIAEWHGSALQLREPDAISSLKAVRHVHLVVHAEEWLVFGIDWKGGMRKLLHKPELEVTFQELLGEYVW